MSSPLHKPTEKTKAKVEAFSCAGFTQEQIAHYLQIDTDTLKKYYDVELRESRMSKIADVSTLAYKRALDGNDKMLELILRTQARWSNPKPPEDIVKDNQQTALLEDIRDSIKKG